ncbi:MAG: dihydroneopterin aldolase [Armatimonadetes bacterium CG_4_10_14_3_um_filter_66_18]|nr:dihydroneopterin aldolase [Armatimonadota bacterium]OIO97359.1 MAG: dihydroneopterin aldolase [Armatimonadetes bacterium CG2_30_66_41]PIU92629.1 MAG: dihydroneopterin aldolase [Armatimonadetes bacterium CG06_land_8_20_14_3_00_66_21]PIX46474.1 MAG: dihydroneopterin aldolase [Armatimonadetes bacterium CG_4_8_14_3_um_filter_66_20]PIY50013.1 MAG: dihydroneopterin aldolase [Armatimonadetes bacterium CG_4_10_14_3_um_filter_66_18]PIZ30417.1 MAG: dihydroneopterin aldolase [Armatimonadetes bacterium
MGDPMDRIFITNLLVRGIIGINPEERDKKQDVIVNVTLHADLSAVRASDNLDESIDYKTVAKSVIDLVESSSYFTVERLADHIADLCLAHPRVQTADVSVEKPGALRFAESVGVAVTKQRGE